MVKQSAKATDVALIKDSMLLRKLNDHTAQVGIVGLGYVGLPTMMAVAEGGFRVTGMDIDESRITSVNSGYSYIEDIHSSLLHDMVNSVLASSS